MAKNNKKHKCGKRIHIKREQPREIRAESYFKRQANTINRLKPVVAAWKRLSERAVQAARDSRSAVQTEKDGEQMQAEDLQGIKYVNVAIDNNIKVPKWVKKRIDWIYRNIACKEIASKEDILKFCRCVLLSIKPFVKGKIVYYTERNGNVLDILFSVESRNERKYLQ